eukprot:jgi/Galph1/1380/GphlegSOOS_G74.1
MQLSLTNYLPYVLLLIFAIVVCHHFSNFLKQTELPLSTGFRNYKLLKKKRITHNTILLQISLPNPKTIFKLPPGKHIHVKASINNKDVVRPYTPISPQNTKGYFELLVKVYPSPFGIMSRYLDSLQPGDAILVSGPHGRFSYSRNMKRCLGMIAGGTGITPIYQLIQTVLNDPLEKTEIRLIFANVSIDDILLKEELERLAKDSSRFLVYFVLNEAKRSHLFLSKRIVKPPINWKQGTGYVNREHTEEIIGFPKKPEKMVLYCGPPPMNAAIHKILCSIGYDEEDMFKF